MRVYTIASGKGGTGKTTIALNVATALATLGKKTLVMDCDVGMANLELLVDFGGHRRTLHDVLAGDAEIDDAIYKGPGGVDIVPGGLSIRGFQKSNPDLLRRVMDDLLGKYDFVIIDAASGLSKEVIVPLALADEVILVVNPEIPSIVDALKTKVIAEKAGSRVESAILNRVVGEKTELTRDKISELLEVPILETIPEDANVRKAAAMKIPLVLWKPEAPAARSFKRIAAKLAGERLPEEDVAAARARVRAERLISRLMRAVLEPGRKRQGDGRREVP
ncbi:MAG TPA: septum site-determining protein MinD [Methanomicrobia archaeon]|nr:septum site-determining protein MinD [Methanomicrobia archaeon]HEX58937.1 septum site-determining protein MinD [Methanomicrobia archaeon]